MVVLYFDKNTVIQFNIIKVAALDRIFCSKTCLTGKTHMPRRMIRFQLYFFF